MSIGPPRPKAQPGTTVAATFGAPGAEPATTEVKHEWDAALAKRRAAIGN
jgi:hypothetical protein